MPTARDITLHEQIRSNLDHLAPGARWRVEGPVGRARKCDIFKITNDRQSHTLALKVYRDNEISTIGPKTQFAALRRYADDTGTTQEPAVNVPQAHAFLPEMNAIVMDWVEAPTLRSVLWRNALSRERQQACVYNTAHWLRRFHATSDITSAPLNTQALLAVLDKRIAQSEAATDLQDSAALFRKCLAALRQHGKNPHLTAPHTILHGDFTPTNILVDGTTVIGIDVWGARRGPVFEDIARMLTYLSIDTPFARERSPLAEDGHANTLFTTFCRGYGRDQLDPENPALWYVLLYQQLRRWIVFADQIRSKRSAIKPRLELTRLRPLCENSLAQLASLSR